MFIIKHDKEHKPTRHADSKGMERHGLETSSCRITGTD